MTDENERDKFFNGRETVTITKNGIKEQERQPQQQPPQYRDTKELWREGKQQERERKRDEKERRWHAKRQKELDKLKALQQKESKRLEVIRLRRKSAQTKEEMRREARKTRQQIRDYKYGKYKRAGQAVVSGGKKLHKFAKEVDREIQKSKRKTTKRKPKKKATKKSPSGKKKGERKVTTGRNRPTVSTQSQMRGYKIIKRSSDKNYLYSMAEGFRKAGLNAKVFTINKDTPLYAVGIKKKR